MFRRVNIGARGNTAQDGKGAQSLGAPQTTKTADPAASRSRPAAEAAKGRPTPKRSEAERGRRQGVTGTPGRGSAGRGGAARGGSASADTKAERLRKNEAMRRGEQWALQARDRGPVRALARDYIDSRRRPSEYYMYLMIAMVIILFMHVPTVEQFAEPVALLLLLLVVIDAIFLRFTMNKLVRARLPGESTRGLTLYTVFRALQIRRFRVPAPRLRPGDKF